ncbi:hypothetical protein [Clostridioides sp. ZZV14-6044]|uniref:hypothetical protein n=1 Tax=unclassified Clostridioides TaxID=2635829 RepID=UPI001D1185D3|nr:hypothetical protein [Clostridioides sp. ZZV14-6104]MCC0744600.1 hypothetical protein [Clostridioides sp. ZZV14-6044]
MNIGSYTLVKKQIVEELKEEIKQKEENLKEREKHIEGLEQKLKNNKKYVAILEGCIKRSTETLRERSKVLYEYNLLTNCILNKEVKKAISIYNKTKSIRIRQKSLNSISKRFDQIK